jgi:nitrogen regulatory protein P-II 1
MKEIDIIFSHERLSAINELLYKHRVGFLFYTIDGRARETRDEVPEILSKEAPYATGRKTIPHYSRGIKLEMIVSDAMAKPIIDEFIATLSTGSTSDGRIFVKDISEGYDIGSKKSWDAMTEGTVVAVTGM